MGGKRIRRRTKKKFNLLNIIFSNGVAAFSAVMLLLLFQPVKEGEPGLISAYFIPPASTPHDELLMGQKILLEGETPLSTLPENALPVMSITIDQSKTGTGAGSVRVNNTTKFTPDYEALLNKKNVLAPQKKGVQVLILHSHASEGYTESNATYYLPNQEPRSTDITQNVVAAGEALTQGLKKAGIDTLHLNDLCDVPSFNSAYKNSLKLAEKAIEENPSIRMIIDMHRDSMITSGGTKYRPVVEIDGKNAAQIMFVMGTSQNGKAHKNWQDNLSFAMQLQSKLNEKYTGLMRPINLRADRFNQHLRSGAMLVELGSCGNSMEEAVYAAQLLAAGIVDLLK